MNDPRVEAVAKALSADRTVFTEMTDRLDHLRSERALKAADAVDRESGIHRICMDDTAVERVAEAIHGSSLASYETHWDDLVRPVKNFRRGQARAVLAALVGADS